MHQAMTFSSFLQSLQLPREFPRLLPRDDSLPPCSAQIPCLQGREHTPQHPQTGQAAVFGFSGRQTPALLL